MLSGEGKALSNLTSSNQSSFLTNLQALRAIAFCAVMLSHTHLSFFAGVGAWGVSIFFVLSGFVMVYSYYNKNRLDKCTIFNNLIFACKKLKRLFLLSFLCTIAYSIFGFVGNETEPVTVQMFFNFLLNFTFLQEWIPFYERSINATSWFLCTILLGYFLFPWFLKVFEKNYSIKKAITWICISIFIELVIGLYGSSFPPKAYVKGELWTYEMTSWFCYDFPLSRIWDMVIGFNLGYLFINSNNLISTKRITILESIGILLAILSSYLNAIMRTTHNVGENPIVMSNQERWWTYSLVFILGSIILVYSFALQKGFFSKLLTNKVTLYLAKISPYGFLIHYVVFRYLEAVYYRIPGFENDEFVIQYGGWCNLTVGIALSLICTDIWMRFYDRFVKPHNFRFI